MESLPVFVTLRGRSVLIAGGTPAAAAKARLALKAGAHLRIVAETSAVSAEMASLLLEPAVTHVPRPFAPADLEGVRLAYTATGDAGQDAAVVAEAAKAGVLVNAVDRPALCDFTTPAIVDRDPVIVAIGTGGAAPVLARRVRAAIDRLLPSRLGALARMAEGFRATVARTLPDGDQRRRFWERLLDGDAARLALEGDEPKARAAVLRLLNRTSALGREATEEPGTVHLVGAGPGDPDLLTLKAQRLLQTADVIVYDDLVGEGVLELARRDASRIYVGKRKGHHSMPQADIGALLVRMASGGRTVVRLKGGDPAIFGRMGEELAVLAEAGIPHAVVPGITAASAAAAAAGISLTHRDHAHSLTFVTAHRRADAPGKEAGTGAGTDWGALARTGGTIAIYMGLTRAEETAQGLIDGGLAAETPVAVVMNASRPEQFVLSGRLDALGALASRAREQGADGPGLLLVGAVAGAASGAAVSAAGGAVFPAPLFAGAPLVSADPVPSGAPVAPGVAVR